MSSTDLSSIFPDADLTNEQRADLGAVAVGAVVDLLGDHGPAVAQAEDVLLYVAHLLDRYGLEPAETFKEALRGYRQDLEGHCPMGRPGAAPARRIADGLTASIEGAS